MTFTSRMSLATALCLAFALPAVASDQTAKLGEENYREADANNDGVLVYAEFATFIDLNAADNIGNAARVKSRGLHARAFERVDANSDNVVTPQELQAIQ